MQHSALGRQQRVVAARLRDDIDDEAVTARLDRRPQQHCRGAFRAVTRSASPDVDPKHVGDPSHRHVRKVRTPVIAGGHKERGRPELGRD